MNEKKSSIQLEKVKSIFNESIQIQIAAEQKLADSIVTASMRMVECLLRGNKIIVCGQGKSQANAQILVTNLLHRYNLERPSLPSVLIDLNNAIVADNKPEQLFTRQLEAIANPNDILVIITPHGRNESIVNLIQAANNRELPIITLSGRQNDHIHGALNEQDLDISIPAVKESRIIENHLLVINILCELIEHQLFSH